VIVRRKPAPSGERSGAERLNQAIFTKVVAYVRSLERDPERAAVYEAAVRRLRKRACIIV
jgi:hypothetical protein